MAIPKDANPLGLPEVIPDLPSFQDHFARSLDKVAADPELRATVGKGVEGNPITVEIVPEAGAWADDMLAGAAGAGEKWVRKIQRPSGNFKDRAIAAAAKHKQRTTEALADDRYAKGMRKVDENEAIATAVAVGSTGYSNGVAARAAKIRRVVGEIQPMVAALKRTLDAMPQENDAQREAKMLAAKRGMQEIGKRRRG